MEALWKTLAEEDDVRLHQRPVLPRQLAAGVHALEHRRLELRDRHLDSVNRVGSREVPMRGDDLLLAKARQLLQHVDVLRVAPQQPALVREHLEEVVRASRRVLFPRGPKLLGEVVKGVRRILEKIEIKDCLWPRQVVLLQVVVKTCARTAKVGYPSSCGETGTNHAYDISRILVLHVPRQALEVGAGKQGLDIRRLLVRRGGGGAGTSKEAVHKCQQLVIVLTLICQLRCT